MTATALDLPGLAAFPKWRRRLRNIPWVLVPLLSLLAVFFAWPVLQLFDAERCRCAWQPDLRPLYQAVRLADLSPGLGDHVQDRGLDNRDHVARRLSDRLFLATATNKTRGLVIFGGAVAVLDQRAGPYLGLDRPARRNGIINNALKSQGIIDTPIPLVFNLTGVIIGMSHALMPLAVLTMFASCRASRAI